MVCKKNGQKVLRIEVKSTSHRIERSNLRNSSWCVRLQNRNTGKFFDKSKSDVLVVCLININKILFFKSKDVSTKTSFYVYDYKLEKNEYCENIEELF